MVRNDEVVLNIFGDLSRQYAPEALGRRKRSLAMLVALFALTVAVTPLAARADALAAVPITTIAPSQTLLPKKTDTTQTTIDDLKQQIDQIASGLQRQDLTDKVLAALRTDAETVQAKASKVIADQTPELDAANARLKQLGPAPQAKEGEPAPIEADAVRQEREAQAKAVAQIEGIVKQAKLISLEADEVVKTVSDRRRTRFADTLTERTRSVLDPGLWVEAFVALPVAVTAFQYMISDGINAILARGGTVAIGFLVAMTALVSLIILALRRGLFRLVTRDEAIEDPAKFRKVAAAAGVAAIQVGAPVIGLGVLFMTLQALNLGQDRNDQAFLTFIEAIAIANAIYGLVIAILAPGKPQWRLVPVQETAVVVLHRLFTGLAVAAGIGLYVSQMLDIVSTSISLIFANSGVFSIIYTVMVMLILQALARAFRTEEDTEETTGDGPGYSILWRWIVPIGWIVAIACLGSAILGYISLARFLSQELIWFGIVLATLFVTLKLIDEAVTAAFMGTTSFSATLSHSMGLSREIIEQVGVILSGLGRLLAIFIAFYFVRPPWADSSFDLLASIRLAFFGFKIGNFTFSPATLLLALTSFGVGIAITRAVQNWLDQRLLPRTRLDTGLKNSISTTFSYFGYVVAAIVAFSAVGIGLENVALVAGALSVGIGFGLQSIVNNFVSGLILLAERPIKAGDLVEIGAEKGYVRKINVRSTEIETFDRASLIVPNSTLISGLVKNWMHRDPSGRCVVTIGVSYDADADQVREIMLATAKAHRLVQTFPGPSVLLTDFGAKAVDFRLVCTVANVNDTWSVESDLRLAVLRRFKKEGIDIPAAQREIKIEGIETLSELMAGRLKPDAKPEA